MTISQTLYSEVNGSAKITGMETFDKSWPIDFFRISHIGIFSLASLKYGNSNLQSFVTKISESLNF